MTTSLNGKKYRKILTPSNYPFKRFEYNILHMNTFDHVNDYIAYFNIEDGKKLMDFKCSGVALEISLSWNMRDVGILFHMNNRQDKEMFFRISRTQIKDERLLSLKHLCRLVVLTSFSQEFLMNQNLPRKLFVYLGIEN